MADKDREYRQALARIRDLEDVITLKEKVCCVQCLALGSACIDPRVVRLSSSPTTPNDSSLRRTTTLISYRIRCRRSRRNCMRSNTISKSSRCRTWTSSIATTIWSLCSNRFDPPFRVQYASSSIPRAVPSVYSVVTVSAQDVTNSGKNNIFRNLSSRPSREPISAPIAQNVDRRMFDEGK